MNDLKTIKSALTLGELHGRESELVWLIGIIETMKSRPSVYDRADLADVAECLLDELEALQWAILMRIGRLSEYSSIIDGVCEDI